MRCEEIMKRNPECAKEQDTIQQTARRMRDENIGFLPVCDNAGKPIGTITDRDITIRVNAEDRKSSTTRVAECMTREVIACKPNDDITKAEQLMGQYKKSRIMVTDDAGKLIGVISLSDIAERDITRAAQTMRDVASREVRA